MVQVMKSELSDRRSNINNDNKDFCLSVWVGIGRGGRCCQPNTFAPCSAAVQQMQVIPFSLTRSLAPKTFASFSNFQTQEEMRSCRTNDHRIFLDVFAGYCA